MHCVQYSGNINSHVANFPNLHLISMFYCIVHNIAHIVSLRAIEDIGKQAKDEQAMLLWI